MLYGLGLMTQDFPCTVGSCKANGSTTTIGHVGVDWGSSAPINEYSPAFDFAINVAVNGESSQNCSNLDVSPQKVVDFLSSCAFCLVAATKNGSASDRAACDCTSEALHTTLTAAGDAMPLQQRRQRQQPLQALGRLPSGPKFCSGTKCTGASANLSHAECLAWKGLFATTGGQSSWSKCADKVADPCSCHGFTCESGHLTGISLPRAGLGSYLQWGALQFPRLTTLDLRDNELFGGVPPELSQLQFLDRLDLSGNLLSGSLPDLGFGLSPAEGGFTMCDLGGNDFSCPLPLHAAHACNGSVLVCSQPDVSSACSAGLDQLFSAPFVSDVVANITHDGSELFGQVDKACQKQFWKGAWNCSIDLDWGRFAPSMDVARDVLKLADKGANFCLVDSSKAFDCGASRPCFENVQHAGVITIASGCSARDYAALATYQGRASQCALQRGQTCTVVISRNASACGVQ